MTYYFDMDGTIADLYGVENWLDMLIAEDTTPYEQARPMVDCAAFIERAMRLKARGIKFGIISWTSRGGSAQYNKAVRQAKIDWLNKNFPNIFDEIHIVKYGTPKYSVKKDYGILFDDEIGNRVKWKGGSYKPEQIFTVI